MRFNQVEVIRFCWERGLYDTNKQAQAFNMGEVGFFKAMCTKPNELGKDTLSYIKDTYGDKVFKRIIVKEDNPTWLQHDSEQTA